MKIYGIQSIGYGRRRCYVLREVLPGRGVNPVPGAGRYPTIEAARAAAASLGISISREGDFYELI